VQAGDLTATTQQYMLRSGPVRLAAVLGLIGVQAETGSTPLQQAASQPQLAMFSMKQQSAKSPSTEYKYCITSRRQSRLHQSSLSSRAPAPCCCSEVSGSCQCGAPGRHSRGSPAATDGGTVWVGLVATQIQQGTAPHTRCGLDCMTSAAPLCLTRPPAPRACPSGRPVPSAPAVCAAWPPASVVRGAVFSRWFLHDHADVAASICQQDVRETAAGAARPTFSRCFRSSRIDSDWFLLMKVVAMPVLPQRPVRPIRCTCEHRAVDGTQFSPPSRTPMYMSVQSHRDAVLKPAMVGKSQPRQYTSGILCWAVQQSRRLRRQSCSLPALPGLSPGRAETWVWSPRQ
jgi:hypothetical protein